MRVRSFFSVKKAEKGGKMLSRKARTATSSYCIILLKFTADSLCELIVPCVLSLTVNSYRLLIPSMIHLPISI